ncbi:MAG: hypothetical protein WBA46_05075 [Thermomicrobiales bacterium]
MVYLEGPGEDVGPRGSGQLNDHERRAIDRFRCPVCDAPLELMESLPDTRTSPIGNEDSCELIAACRLCDISFTQDDWHEWLRAA